MLPMFPVFNHTARHPENHWHLMTTMTSAHLNAKKRLIAMQIQRKFPGAQSLTMTKKTRGHSQTSFCRNLKQTKLTASNFGAAAKRCNEPDNLLKAIMYPKQFKSKSLMYGHMQEQNAVDDYVKCKHACKHQPERQTDKSFYLSRVDDTVKLKQTGRNNVCACTSRLRCLVSR